MRYEKYKSLDELWLDNIPTEWVSRKIKYLFSERSEKGYPEEQTLVASQNMGVVPKGVYGNRTVEATKDLHLLKLVRIGDFVISLRSFQGGIEYAYYQGIISPAYTIMISKGALVAGYFKYLSKSRLFIELLQMCVTGIREGQNIDYTKLKNHQIPVPPREEQDQIVRYLDWQVSRINRLIAAKKKQIAILREQIRCIVSNTVFYGIDHSTVYKEANIFFVGKIPKHWQAKRGKYLLAEHDVRSLTGTEELLSVSHITGITPRSQKNVTMFKAESLIGYKVCAIDDIAANTMWLWQGAIAVSSYHGVISPSYNTYHQINGAYECRYLDYLLRAKPMVDEYRMRSTGIRKSRLRLYPEQFLAMFFPVPPIDEQDRIADYIERQSEKIEILISSIEHEIVTLHELRARLISDVVTGQMDVRSIEVPDFEMVEEIDESAEEDDVSEETDEQEE